MWLIVVQVALLDVLWGVRQDVPRGALLDVLWDAQWDVDNSVFNSTILCPMELCCICVKSHIRQVYSYNSNIFIALLPFAK